MKPGLGALEDSIFSLWLRLEEHMTKEDLLTILKKLLRTERSLDFLHGLDEEDVRTLIVCIRDRLERESRDH
jgi:hypothetical protein